MYLIKTRKGKSSVELGRRIAAVLKKKRLKFDYLQNIKITAVTKEDILVVAGDDQLILETFKELGSRQTPLLGVATSSSFLAETNMINFEQSISLIEKNKYSLYPRKRFLAIFDKRETPIALNDIGIFPSLTAKLLRYDLIIDGELFWQDTADGVIISTPTGATGYGLSAGGPIIVKEPDVFSITPLTTLDKSHAPLIVSDKSIIEFSNIESKSPAVIVVDGITRIPLKGGKLRVELSKYPANFIRFSKPMVIEDRLKKRSVAGVAEKVKLLAPSAKLVYRVVASENEMTQKEIINATYLPDRTVRHALELLERKGIIKKKPFLNDARQMNYSVE